MISHFRLRVLAGVATVLTLVASALPGSALADSNTVENTNSTSIAAPLVAAPRALDISGMNGGSSGMSVWRSMGALLVVLGIMFLVTRFLKGHYPGAMGMGKREKRRMTLVERLTVDHKRQIVIVRVDDKDLVLAVAPDRMSLLVSMESKPLSPDGIGSSRELSVQEKS